MGIGPYEGVKQEKKAAPQWVSGDDEEKRQKEKRLEKASLDELDELEDDEEEAVLEKYRKMRLEQLKMQAAAAKRLGNGLPEISKNQWKDEVTEAAFQSKVVVLLYKPGDEWCALLERQLAIVAERFPHTKFVKIIYTSAISNYPDSQLPALLIYHKNNPIQQIVGLQAYAGGSKMNADDVEWALHIRGVIKSEMEENPRTGALASAEASSVRYDYVGGGLQEDY